MILPTRRFDGIFISQNVEQSLSTIATTVPLLEKQWAATNDRWKTTNMVLKVAAAGGLAFFIAKLVNR